MNQTFTFHCADRDGHKIKITVTASGRNEAYEVAHRLIDHPGSNVDVDDGLLEANTEEA